jgi:hypothetical protein
MDTKDKEADIKTLQTIGKIFNINKEKIANAINKINEAIKNEQK